MRIVITTSSLASDQPASLADEVFLLLLPVFRRFFFISSPAALFRFITLSLIISFHLFSPLFSFHYFHT